MATSVIGRVIGGKTRNSYEVKWDSFSGATYVSYAGWSNVGRKAQSAQEAMSLADAFVYDK